MSTADAAFREGKAELTAPPTVFYVNLTERCQLACAHCITRAPETTAAGRARSLAPEVLKALAPHLAHARYVGFTHSGEPLLSPTLVPFLEALRAQRNGAPTTVHVITNGMALTERRFTELCALGLNSWSFSLDGVTAQTNDALRLGAKIDVLMPRLTALSRLRSKDVRLGVSCTVTRSNLSELDAMVRFVKGAGLDWLKLEETFPLNERATREADIPRADLDTKVTAATRLADELKLIVVNHTRAHDVWKCVPSIMDGPSARFSAADDFANRLDINPCRGPWEVVCIEPDGDLKPQDFHQPAVGNLLQHDLISLWNAPGFVGRRRHALSRRRCQTPTCAAL
ncbi:MAG: radical SAM protein [Archangium sp.]|nr:radical SAM protein [Archangium sp.]